MAEPTFSFGKNWKEFLATVTTEALDTARQDVVAWLGEDTVAGQRVLDIGSGSGIHSLAFLALGASEVVSFDADPHSVEATQKVYQDHGSPSPWQVMPGSVLDRAFLGSLGTFHIVYSWGVLHHTGSMWEALENASTLVKDGGTLFISIYQKGPRYPRDLALKRAYNAASPFGQWLLRRREITIQMLRRLKHGRNPFAWNEKKIRGMNVYHDIVDWLGGLPYEVATADEIDGFFAPRGFVLERIGPRPEGGCSIYVYRKRPSSPAGELRSAPSRPD